VKILPCKPEERDNLIDLGVEGGVVLKLILKEYPCFCIAAEGVQWFGSYEYSVLQAEGNF
jgi:hypothetical protein